MEGSPYARSYCVSFFLTIFCRDMLTSLDRKSQGVQRSGKSQGVLLFGKIREYGQKFFNFLEEKINVMI